MMNEQKMNALFDGDYKSAGPWTLSFSVVDDESEEPNMVNQPPHYTQGGIECIDAIKAAVTGKPPYEAFLVGQIIKYIWRYNFKNGAQDVEKAEFYMKKLVKEVSDE